MAVHDVAHEAAEAQAIRDRGRRGQGRPALEHGAVLPATREEVVPAVDAVEAGGFQAPGGLQPPPRCHADRGDVDADAGPCALAPRAPRLLLPRPRHGRAHQSPPHMINFRANVWAMRELGVTRIIGPCAAGSLRPEVRPGEFVVCGQLADRTPGRKDTFYDGPNATHIAFADPYCPELRPLAIATARDEGIPVHDGGTMVVIPGPRFSTRAESRWFAAAGWSAVGMTQYPEAYLARELEICFVNVSLITDYDVGVEGVVEAVTHEAVLQVFNANIEKLRRLLFRLVPPPPAAGWGRGRPPRPPPPLPTAAARPSSSSTSRNATARSRPAPARSTTSRCRSRRGRSACWAVRRGAARPPAPSWATARSSRP